jgi:hypothetical protein
MRAAKAHCRTIWRRRSWGFQTRKDEEETRAGWQYEETAEALSKKQS